MRPSTPSRANTCSCALRGHMVLDSTPTLMPRPRSSRKSGAASGSVNVCGSHALKYPARNASVAVTPARSKTWASVALRCERPVSCHRSRSAAQMAAAISPARPPGKCGRHTASHSASWSIVCHGVSVPPQSKITARTVTSAWYGRSACSGPVPGAAREYATPGPVLRCSEEPGQRELGACAPAGGPEGLGCPQTSHVKQERGPTTHRRKRRRREQAPRPEGSRPDAEAEKCRGRGGRSDVGAGGLGAAGFPADRKLA